MRQDAVRYINQVIMRQAAKLRYRVASVAPSTVQDLVSSTSLVVWSGESHNTIFNDAAVNHAFRALHDALHLKTGLDFSPAAEIELGRIQASQYDSDLMRELVYCEVSMQAAYHLENGVFVPDQCSFTEKYLKNVLKF
jgi:3-dehydroquinate dehydratase